MSIKEETADLRKIFDNATADADYVRDVAHAKRALELWTMVPGWRDEFAADPAAALKKYGVATAPEDVRILTDREAALAHSGFGPDVPRVVRRYRGFILEKVNMRRILREQECVPTDKKFRAWRERQINRCWAEIGEHNEDMIHTPFSFELSDGCSVGCPFCGLAAGKLSGVFRHTPENSALWRECLAFVHELAGDAANQAPLYYASEPLDNPDYEEFVQDFYDEFGAVSQMTTAASMRNPARTRAFLDRFLPLQRRVHRFSVLSLAMLNDIFAEFTPEELVRVELLPQYAEAPANRFTDVGRAREHGDWTKDDRAGSISCLSGFVVNMARRDIRLTTPCRADAAHPTGEMTIVREKFTTADDFRRVMTAVIDRYMVLRFSHDEPLVLRPNFAFQETGDGFSYGRKGSEATRAFVGNRKLPPQVFQAVLKKLQTAPASAYSIAEALLDDDIAPEAAFYVADIFCEAGLTLEPYEINQSADQGHP